MNANNTAVAVTVPSGLTEVKGYFNPHAYPVQIAISDLNLVIGLPPGGYVNDTRGRPINDPILSRYVNRQGLAVEKAPAPVPILLMPANPVHKASVRTNPVGVGYRDENGKWHPPAPLTEAQQIQAAQAAPSVSRASHQAMSVEEARRRGYIGAQRLVPEDYGRAENQGTPDRGNVLPTIKHSIEAPARNPAARVQALPSGYADEVAALSERAPQVAGIVEQLTSAAAKEPAPVPAQFRSDEVDDAKEAAGVYVAPEVRRKIAKPVQPGPLAHPQPGVVQGIPVQPKRPLVDGVRRVDVKLPAPVLRADAVERAEGVAGTVPEGEADEDTDGAAEGQAQAPTKERKARNREQKPMLVCEDCGREYRFASQLKTHQRVHLKRVEGAGVEASEAQGQVEERVLPEPNVA